MSLLAAAGCRSHVEGRVARIFEWEREPTATHVERIREALSDAEAPVRAGALAALVRLGTPDAAERSLAALRDPAGSVRAAAVKCLLDLEDPRAVPELLRVAAEDTDWQVRRGAVEAAGSLVKDASAAEPLVHALGDGSTQVRLAAIGAVSRHGVAGALEALSRLAREETSWENRAAAVVALGRTGLPEAYAPVGSAALDANEFVRGASAAALRELRRSGVGRPEEAAAPAPAESLAPGSHPAPKPERPPAAGGGAPLTARPAEAGQEGPR